MESLFCSAAQDFAYANEPKGDATKAIDDVFGLAFNFCISCTFGRTKRIETTSSSHNGTSFKSC